MADNSKFDQVNYPLMMYSMNVSAMLDDVARVGVCNAATYGWWSAQHQYECNVNNKCNLYTDEEWTARCGSYLPDANALQAAADQIKKYFDPSEAAGLLLGSGGKILSNYF